ncbi:glycosyltransferase family 2 protein [Solwaraspora sp. WMMB762]|uniref:glycosyltransferase family 2 protein n=1 Tax=Solwaraspora sp. WMMB762 TaxID=3404120 RepID=UPI003B953221
MVWATWPDPHTRGSTRQTIEQVWQHLCHLATLARVAHLARVAYPCQIGQYAGMGTPLISIVIPYKQRLDNVRMVFASLAEQTLDRARFEVVVGAIGYDHGYLRLCQEYARRLDIATVMVERPWNTSHARNIALRQASGDVVVLLDADVMLPPRCLESMHRRYFADGTARCVIGQLIGYDNFSTTEAVAAAPFSRHRAVLARLDATTGLREDPRWRFEPVTLPWTMVWTGFVAISGDVVRRHGIYFDEDFCGWGAEDQEWGYRIAATNTPILLGTDLCGLHLPHARDAEINFAAFATNKARFLAKWPRPDVELFRASDSWVANREIGALRAEVSTALDGEGQSLGVARGTANGVDVLVVGLALDEAGEPVEDVLDPGTPRQVTPLIGLALPYADGDLAECRVLPRVLRLGERFRDMVLAEAARVARRVETPSPSGS